MRILIVEDERALGEALAHILKKNNYTADNAFDGEEGLDDALSGIYDIIILDIMLPKMDGITVLKNIRDEGINTPVILLTAKGEISDKVKGLDAGADDYLAKPFSTDELLARIRALSRRRSEITSPSPVIYFGDIALNTQTLVLSKENHEIKLTLKEKELLEYLIINKNIVSSKELIIEKLWGFDSEAESNHVEVYVSFLRKKLKYVNSNVSINAVRGVGYILDTERTDAENV